MEKPLDDPTVIALADRLWALIVGAGADPADFNLRAKLALEARFLPPGDRPSFGLDKLDSSETAAYIGVQVATLQDRHKRRALDLPQPYPIARKLFWRRSNSTRG